ncbi:MAG TPA: LEA type 2 family protein [Steroidobacteraceae bacterium]|jgi:LEA14-like dessication related protein
MKLSFPRACALALLLSALCACSLTPKLETPRLTIINVAMMSADMFNQQFLVHLNVQNPNDRQLAIKGIEYTLFLEGDGFAEGTSQPIVLPAKGETEFDLTVHTNFVSSIGRLLSRLNGKQTVDYEIEGKVVLESGMIRTIPFRESGQVSIKLKK